MNFIIVILLAAAAGSFGSAAIASPATEWYPVPVELCPNSPYSAPLKRTVPTLQDFEIEINKSDDMQYSSVAKINFKIDDSQSQGDEPKNVFILNADSTLDVKKTYVFDIEESTGRQLGFVEVTEGIPPASICRDTVNNLLVVTMKGDLKDKSSFGLAVRYGSPIRHDGRGLHRVSEADVFKADFSNGQASLIAPCIEGRKSAVDLTVLSGFGGMKVTSSVAELKRNAGFMGIFGFKRIPNISVDELSFEAFPEKRWTSISLIKAYRN